MVHCILVIYAVGLLFSLKFVIKRIKTTKTSNYFQSSETVNKMKSTQQVLSQTWKWVSG